MPTRSNAQAKGRPVSIVQPRTVNACTFYLGKIDSKRPLFSPVTECLANSLRVTQQCQQLAALLREIRDRASVQDSNRITDLLDEVSVYMHSPCCRIKGNMLLVLIHCRLVKTCQNIGLRQHRQTLTWTLRAHREILNSETSIISNSLTRKP